MQSCPLFPDVNVIVERGKVVTSKGLRDEGESQDDSNPVKSESTWLSRPPVPQVI